MIDIHFHCLPGIDDGPRSWDDAVALCRAAAAEGTTHIVATPHVLREPWLNESRDERAALVAEINHRLGGDPLVLEGCEYFMGIEAVDLWELGSDGPLVGLGGSNHLLIEFAATALPRNARALIHELVVAGVTPVIAHPERNLIFASDLDQLEQLVERGAKVQVTAASVTGDFGRAALDASQRMLDRDLVHVIASDAHSLAKRPPSMAAARERIRTDWGDELTTLLFETNTRLYAGLV